MPVSQPVPRRVMPLQKLDGDGVAGTTVTRDGEYGVSELAVASPTTLRDLLGALVGNVDVVQSGVPRQTRRSH
jgi:hypothetical protein